MQNVQNQAASALKKIFDFLPEVGKQSHVAMLMTKPLTYHDIRTLGATG